MAKFLKIIIWETLFIPTYRIYFRSFLTIFYKNVVFEL